MGCYPTREMAENRVPTATRGAKAVVFPAGTVSGYGHIWSLGRAGVPVVALHPRRCASFASRHVHERHVVPDPLTDSTAFIAWLVAYGQRQSEPPVLFLAEDVYAFLVSHHHQALRPLFRYSYLDDAARAIAFDKRAMLPAAARAGLPVPAHVFSPLDEAGLLSFTRFPAVLKPTVSRFTFRDGQLVDSNRFPALFGGKALRIDDREELRRVARAVGEAGIDYVVQELVAGQDRELVNVKLVAGLDHEVRAAFTSRKLRQVPPGFGTCAVARSEALPGIVALAARFCLETRLVGPASFEFKWCARDRRYQFIEVNPRLDYWVRMAALKGVNLPFEQYLLGTGQEPGAWSQTVDEKCWIDMVGDFAGRPAARLPLLEFLRPYRRFDEAVWNLADPLPGAWRWARLASTLLRRR